MIERFHLGQIVEIKQELFSIGFGVRVYVLGLRGNYHWNDWFVKYSEVEFCNSGRGEGEECCGEGGEGRVLGFKNGSIAGICIKIRRISGGVCSEVFSKNRTKIHFRLSRAQWGHVGYLYAQKERRPS